MAGHRQSRGRRRRVPVAAILLAVVAITLLFAGGSSRADAAPLVLLRPVMVFALAALLLVPLDEAVLRRLAVPLWLLGGFAGLIALQLVPLPVDLWLALPGHARFASAITLAGDAGSWRPLSVAPERTWSSLMVLAAPATVLIGYAALPERLRAHTLPLLIGAGLASALLGIGQMLGGSLYLYQVRESVIPTGVFANRNHQGVFLAMMLPALRAWTLAGSPSRAEGRRRAWIAGGAALLLTPMVLVTQSRAGFGVMILGMIASALAAPPRRTARSGRIVLIALGALAVVAGFVALTLWIGRDTAFGRLLASEHEEFGRLSYVPTIVEMIRASFPLGYGFGSFDPVFRSFEPLALLKPSYVNNAHNDLLELTVTGGLPALAILAAFLVWTTRRGIAAFQRSDRGDTSPVARAAAIMIAMVLLASLIDYPLRTPLMAGIMALLVAWLAAPPHGPDGARQRAPSAGRPRARTLVE